MHISAKEPARAGLVFAALLTLGCDSPLPLPVAPPPTPTGTIEVTVTTTSIDGVIDPDGYFLYLDTEPLRLIAANGKVTFAAVPAGIHIVYLSGVASGCSISGGSNSISVEIPALKSTPRVPISFVVICQPAPPPGPSPWDF